VNFPFLYILVILYTSITDEEQYRNDMLMVHNEERKSQNKSELKLEKVSYNIYNRFPV